MKKTGKYDILRDFWNAENLNNIPNLGETRLVPLNKVYPEIPKENEFRPIAILSSLYKFLSLRFIYKLRKYATDRLHAS